MTDAESIVYGIFKKTCLKFVTALRANSKLSADLDVLNSTMDGLAYGTVISIQSNLTTERMAFTEPLAVITYLGLNVSSEKSKLTESFARGDHLKQDWYKPYNLLSEKHPLRACQVILNVAKKAKLNISYERTQVELRRLQSLFGDDIVLVAPNRKFLKEGKLYKMYKNGGKKLYNFFLFNDVLIYASNGTTTKYKVHRVLHLSLCAVIDLTPLTFKISSSQKSVVIIAQNKKQKLFG